MLKSNYGLRVQFFANVVVVSTLFASKYPHCFGCFSALLLNLSFLLKLSFQKEWRCFLTSTEPPLRANACGATVLLVRYLYTSLFIDAPSALFSCKEKTQRYVSRICRKSVVISHFSGKSAKKAVFFLRLTQKLDKPACLRSPMRFLF